MLKLYYYDLLWICWTSCCRTCKNVQQIVLGLIEFEHYAQFTLLDRTRQNCRVASVGVNWV